LSFSQVMDKFRIQKIKDDVLITRWTDGFEKSVQFPYEVFADVVEEILSHPHAEGSPVTLQVSNGQLEIPYTDFMKLSKALNPN
jgi:hypothetical protein